MDEQAEMSEEDGECMACMGEQLKQSGQDIESSGD